MNVRDLIKYCGSEGGGDPVEVSGWLVANGVNVYLLDEECVEPYMDSEKIKVANPEIGYSIRNSILPLGGGLSWVFHRSKIRGKVLNLLELELFVLDLVMQERGGASIRIPIDDDTIALAKEKYKNEVLRAYPSESRDWLDYAIWDSENKGGRS